MISIEQLPGLLDGPRPVGEPEFLVAAGKFEAYAIELEMLWRWDLFKDGEHFHTGSALSRDSVLRSAEAKIKFFGSNEEIAELLKASQESSGK